MILVYVSDLHFSEETIAVFLTSPRQARAEA